MKVARQQSSTGETERPSPKRQNQKPNRPERVQEQRGRNSKDHPLLQIQRSRGNQAVQRLLKEQDRSVIQPKLKIGQSNDRYEREADRVAEQVMRMPSSQGRAPRCACGGIPGPDGECTACKEKRLGLQRFSSAPAGPSEASPAVYDVLGHPGQPLDAGTRRWMESRFGHDFGSVRVHTDGRAGASARAVGARAYTVGERVVFDTGEYAPGTKEGQRLLAHELTHVMQQRRSSAPVLRRENRHSSAEVNAPANTCSLEQTRELVPAVSSAQQWVRQADTRLSSFITSPPRSPERQRTALGLLRHFHASDPDTARYVQNIIRQIADRLRTDPRAPSPLTVECHGESDTSCGGSGAYVSGPLLVFCPGYFSESDRWQVFALIHEIAHSIPTISRSMRITDRAYRSDRLYRSLSPGQALTNAESYAMFVREMALGSAEIPAPRDTYEDCPTDWRRALDTATARAQRWNRDAQTILQDQRPGILSQWSALASTHLGGQSAPQLAAAEAVYDQAWAKLQEEIDFECEVNGGGRCDTSLNYWYALGDFHICPSWRQLPTDDDRTEALLAGLYGYFDIVDDSNRRRRLARLARDLHYQFWAPPSAADVNAALSTARTQPQPAPAPTPGPRPGL